MGQVISIDLFTTSHTKAFTFGGPSDFQMKFGRIKDIKLVEVEITLKGLTKNNLEDIKDQILNWEKWVIDTQGLEQT